MKIFRFIFQTIYGGLFLWIGLFFLLIGSVGELKTPFYNSALPLLTCVTFYFGVFRSDFKNAVFAFILGILTDIMGGYPIGLNAFLLTLLFFVSSLNTRILPHLTFNKLWFVFSLFLICYLLLFKFLMILSTPYSGHGMDLFLQYILTVMCFPFVAGLSGLCNKMTESVK